MRKCQCGCEAELTGKKSRFRPGHDAKLKSRLLQQLRGEDPAQVKSAQQQLEEQGWAHLVTIPSGGGQPKSRDQG